MEAERLPRRSTWEAKGGPRRPLGRKIRKTAPSQGYGSETDLGATWDIKLSKAKQSKAKQSKAKLSKAKQSKAKLE